MNLITFDLECYYDKDYSLSKMQTDAYVLDPRFQEIGVGIKINDAPAYWVANDFDGKAIRTCLDEIDWADAAVICHNTLFDGFYLTQRMGIRPKLWMDTLGMARMIYPWSIKHNLATIAELTGAGVKGKEVEQAIGKRLEDFNPAELNRYGDYCINDVELTYKLAKHFLNQVPPMELKLIDMTIRMFTEPQLVGDPATMEKLYNAELARKVFLLDDANVSKDTIMSNDKFANELLKRGVTPPMKLSARTGKQTWAFAKSDKEFTALLDHHDSDVQTLVAARLGVKTTIAETRAWRMLETTKRDTKLAFEIGRSKQEREAVKALEGASWEGGALPVYLNFWGAKVTGRYSGGNQINWQNIPARGPSAGLREAIMAPTGFKVVVGDSSNIELRVAMVCAGQRDVVDKLASGLDLYCDFASKLFGRVITKADKKERQIGKIAMLSLQYGAGWAKFKEMVRVQSGEILADESAQAIVDLYRNVHGRIKALWDYCGNDVLIEIYNNHGTNMLPVDVNAWCITGNDGFGVLGAPGVVYKNLHRSADGGWAYSMGNDHHVKIYGGKVVENLCQHVARQIVMWQTARVNQRYPVALSVHDEVVCVVPDAEVAACQKYMEECLSMAPPWCGGLIPLACETGVGQSYGEAK